jgi:hypothetical protein
MKVYYIDRLLVAEEKLEQPSAPPLELADSP